MARAEFRQVAHFDRQNTPTDRQEAQMVHGLRSAWEVPATQEVIYAHPERFEKGALRQMFESGAAEGVLLHDNESVLGWLALVHHERAGNTEIGSVNATSGNGVALVEKTYEVAKDKPFLLIDAATCRTGMEQVARKAADNTGERIVVPTYVDPNVWGDKSKGIDWGCVGYFAISTRYLAEGGPISLPQLPEGKQLRDGTEEIISDVMMIGNIEGESREMQVFGQRHEEDTLEPRGVRGLTEGLVAVDYMDIDSRKIVLNAGYKPCGIEMGVLNDQVVVDVHYSPLELNRSAFGKNAELTVRSHPVRTNVAPTRALAELINTRRQDARPQWETGK